MRLIRWYWGQPWPPQPGLTALMRFYGIDLFGLSIGRWRMTEAGRASLLGRYQRESGGSET